MGVAKAWSGPRGKVTFVSRGGYLLNPGIQASLTLDGFRGAACIIHDLENRDNLFSRQLLSPTGTYLGSYNVATLYRKKSAFTERSGHVGI